MVLYFSMGLSNQSQLNLSTVPVLKVIYNCKNECLTKREGNIEVNQLSSTNLCKRNGISFRLPLEYILLLFWFLSEHFVSFSLFTDHISLVRAIPVIVFSVYPWTFATKISGERLRHVQKSNIVKFDSAIYSDNLQRDLASRRRHPFRALSRRVISYRRKKCGTTSAVWFDSLTLTAEAEACYQSADGLGKTLRRIENWWSSNDSTLNAWLPDRSDILSDIFPNLGKIHQSFAMDEWKWK
jgi:hypothetical protein